MPAAIPLIAQGASMVGGAIASRRAQKSAEKAASQRSPEEQAALRGGQRSAGQLTQTGTQLTGTGLETQAPATSYFTTLLRGNQAAQQQAVAGPAAQIRDLYAGAERGLERSGRTPTATARAELQREQAGKLASLVSGVQPAAAAALTDIGQTQISQGVGASQAGGSIYSGLLGQGAANRTQGQQVGRATGAATGQQVGGLLFDVITGLARRPSAGAKLPSRPTTTLQSWMPSGSGGF